MKLIKCLLAIFILSTLFACSSDKLKTKEVNKEEFYVYCGYEYPSVLGAPELTKDEINKLTEDDAWEKINTYIDFLLFAKQVGFTSTYAFVKENYDLLLGDYEDIGVITVPGSKALLYLKTNGLYYPIDMENSNKSWLKEYPIDSISYSSIKDLRDAIEKAINGKTSNHSFIPEGYVYGEEIFINVLGKRKMLVYSLGTKVYEHAGVQIPLGLGLPEYTDVEIDEMINSKEYETIAQRIHTFADAVNYVIRANYKFCDTTHVTYSTEKEIDVGNIMYADDPNHFVYSISGLEQLIIKEVQCTSASTLFNYLLKDDYPEIGYMHVRFTDGDGYGMIYIKGHDSKYYLVNPLDYIDSVHISHPEWLYFYLSSKTQEKGCCDTLEELMKDFITSDYPAKPNVEVETLYTVISNDVFCSAQTNAEYGPTAHSTYIFSKGSKATCWLGNPNIEYADAKYASIDAIYGFKETK